MSRPLSILLVNCDWRDVFQTSFEELRFKLERDRLHTEYNNFFILSYSTVSYRLRLDEHFESLHLKTRLRRVRPLLDFLSLWRLLYHVWRADLKPDVILIYDMGFLPGAALIRWLCGAQVVMVLTNMPSVYSAARRWGSFKRCYARALEYFCVNIPDLFYTINQTMRTYARALGVPSEKILVFTSDTISQEKELVQTAIPGFLRHKLSLGPEQRIMLSVGRLEAEKDFSRLLRAFATLPSEWVLVIIGRGSLLQELEGLTRELGIHERVFFEGFVPRQLIWKYYRDADVFALFSKAEALGLVFWEAMYAEVPVLGSIAPGIVESLGENDERGLVWRNATDVHEFSVLVKQATVDSPERTTRLRRAREYVDTQLSQAADLNSWFEKQIK